MKKIYDPDIAQKLNIRFHKAYETFCDEIEEYINHSHFIRGIIKIKIKEDYKILEDYANQDHSNIGGHFHPLVSYNSPISDFIIYLGVYWDNYYFCPVSFHAKEFVLAPGNDKIILGAIITQKKRGNFQYAFFTESFFNSFSNFTKLGKDYFFITAIRKGYISSQDSDEIRWLFSEGLAFGYKYGDFYVFYEFTDEIKYQGEELTDETMKKLDDLLWNNEW